MRVIRDLKNIKEIAPLSLTIGNFDGVHLGHQKIIEQVKKKALEKNLKSAILTFFPHPIKFFKPDLAKNFLLYNFAQKLNFFKQNSIDYVFILKFDAKLANLEAEKFVEEILVKTLNVKDLTIGYDFIFGKNRHGNFDFLNEISKKNSFEVEKIQALIENDLTISSSQIREFIQNGKIKEASNFLGKNYEIQSVVVNGKKIAQEIGFKTANLKASPQIILPKFGVYKTKTKIIATNQEFNSITNFGIKPTFSENYEPIFENHLLNYEGKDFYGAKIKVEFLDFIRPEKKFSSISELKNQIKDDISALNFKK